MEFLYLVPILIFAFLAARQLVSATFTTTVQASDIGSAGGTTTVSGEAKVFANPLLAAGKPGVLTTRTSGTVGSLTMETGHGITTGQRIDLYWSGGQAYGCVVGTVSGLVVPIASTAGGDAFPVAASEITAGIINEAVFDAVGDDVEALVISCDSGFAGYAVIADGSGNLLANYVTPTAPYIWHSGLGTTNPIAGDTATKVYVSQRGEDTAASAIRILAITN